MAISYNDTKEKRNGHSVPNHIFMLLQNRKKIILEKSSNQGLSPPNHVVTNKGKQDKRAGFKLRIVSCIWQMFVHSFILLTTLNWVYMCCNKAPAFNKTVHCTVYV